MPLIARTALPLLVAAALAAVVAPVLAQTAGDTSVAPSPPQPDKRAEQAAKQAEYDSITKAITLTEDRQAALKTEMAALAKDRTKLNAALLEAGKRSRQFERQIGATERRITKLTKQEDDLRGTLEARRAVLAEVLAALQRMGRRPPPAIVVRPEDALTSVRSAILLGAVVPELKTRADDVAASLRDLVGVRERLDSEKASLKADATQLAEERERITLLIEERKKAEAQSQDALDAERNTARDLAQKATGLKELIDKLETEIATVSDAAEKARAAEAKRQAADAAAANQVPSVPDANRIAPAIAFAEAREMLPRPVAGVEIRGYAEADGIGGKSQGLSIATRSAAQVTSPADGWVVYAGPFRSYGELLIVNCGGGYHILLAGMERIEVEIGQFVLAGEPVAVMGDRRLVSVGAPGIGASQPVLYVEFRKDGAAIDPSPWWARSDDEKVSG